MIASETGEATTYGLYNTQERGEMFIGPQTPVYEGMIVGRSPKLGDIAVNVCKKKHLTSIRSSGADEKLLLTPPVIFSLAVSYTHLVCAQLQLFEAGGHRYRRRFDQQDRRGHD